MILRYYGHSLFTIELENGITILTDPYGTFRNYPKRTLNADIVTISHHHHDHDGVDMVAGAPVILDREGVFSPAPGLSVTSVPTSHDAQNGALRGNNLVFIFEAEGLKLVHMGDTGHILTDRQRSAIGTPDVLMLPVGGTFTTDAAEAVENLRLLRPRIAVPMHYKTAYSTDMPIETEQPFLNLLDAHPEPVRLCRLTKGDIGERPPVMLFEITADS